MTALQHIHILMVVVSLTAGLWWALSRRRRPAALEALSVTPSLWRLPRSRSRDCVGSWCLGTSSRWRLGRSAGLRRWRRGRSRQGPPSPGSISSAASRAFGCLFCEQTTSRGYETGTSAWARAGTRGRGRRVSKARFTGKTWSRMPGRARQYRL